MYNFANRTSSFKFGPSVTRNTIFTDKNYRGTSSSRIRDDNEMGGTSLNKRINSIIFNL